MGLHARSLASKPVEQTTSAASSAGPLRISGTARLLQTRAPALEDPSQAVTIRPSSNAICLESIPYAEDCGSAIRTDLLPFAEATWTTMSRSTTGARPPSTTGPRSRVLSFASNLPQASQPRARIPAFRAVTPRPLSQRGRQPPHPSFPRQLCHRHHNLLPPIATQPLQSQPSSPQNPSATNHFDYPNTAQTTGSRLLIDSMRSHFRDRAAGKRYGKGYGNGQAIGEQSGRSM